MTIATQSLLSFVALFMIPLVGCWSTGGARPGSARCHRRQVTASRLVSVDFDSALRSLGL
jgi:hypothetical protein